MQPPNLHLAQCAVADLTAAGRACDAENLIDDTLNQVKAWLREALDLDTARAMRARQNALRAMLRASLAEPEPWTVTR